MTNLGHDTSSRHSAGFGTAYIALLRGELHRGYVYTVVSAGLANVLKIVLVGRGYTPVRNIVSCNCARGHRLDQALLN